MKLKSSLLTVFALPLIFSMVALASPAIQDNQPTGASNQKSIDRIYKDEKRDREPGLR